MKHWLVSNSPWAKDVGLLIMRVGLGLIFMRHGYGKITGSTASWLWLGNQMANLGITFAPLFWGFCAASTEFFGGIALVGGFGTRIAAFLLSCVMFVASIHHITKGDSFGYLSHPLSLLFVFIGIMVAGGGRYSIDHMFK